MTQTPATKRLLKDAAKFVQTLDRHDGGVTANQIDMALRTVMTALEVAINTHCWKTASEALVMLAQIEHKYRPADQKVHGYFLVNEFMKVW